MTNYIDKENAQLSFAWERPTVATLGSKGVTASVIGSFTGLTVNAYVGQMLRVLSGNQKGYIYHILSNTATRMTVEGIHAPNATSAIGSGDRVAWSTNGISPGVSSVTTYLGTVETFQPPTREQEVQDYFSHGSGVTRAYSFVKKIKYQGGSLPVGLQGRPEILMGLGRTAITGTDSGSGGGSTLSASVQPWDNTISITSATGYLANDYIQIDTTTSAEVRKISSIDGTTFTLDQPLDYAHASGATCNEVVAPWTYTIYPSAALNRSFTVLRAFSDPAGDDNDVIEEWHGNYIESASFSSGEDQELQATIGFRGMTYTRTTDGTSKPTVTVDTANPYFWDGSTVNYNSVAIGIIREFAAEWSWDLEDVYAHGGFTTKRPYRIYRKRPSFTGNYTYIPVSDTLKGYGDVATEYDSYVQLTRSATDYFKLSFVDAVVIKDDWPTPESGYVTGDHQMSPEQI